MNPFARFAPIPAGSQGERGFASAADAKAAGAARSPAEYCILRAGQEYAWITAQAVYARLGAALIAGIALVETCKV